MDSTPPQRHGVLEANLSEVFKEFQLKKIVVQKTHTEFSDIATDQAHKHASNAGWCWINCVTEDQSALRLASHLEAANKDNRHHEQNSQTQKSFTDKAGKLFGAMKGLGNPFLEESKELALDTDCCTS